METLDRKRMSEALYPALQALRAQGKLSNDEIKNTIAACAEGYAFPCNLDCDQPIGGMAPQTQEQIMLEALDQEWPEARFIAALESKTPRQQA